ncbi:MAG: N-acetyl-gamma-glutamyl-phosphate reductase [Candidatus Thermoplasmatota archaeon]|nr:N-acetyl-gamma-glutamyl-phosphate reductase [Candidatus Thermoplasmatota archaeon]MBS3801722.1 N-acetyl-gamma-glutamyl-phosphate reductase [Candidatus Thermoplasmatota archaeon]
MTIEVGIIGATGYTGSELTRILTQHNQIDLSMITSRSFAGKKISDVHPYLEGICDQKLSNPSIDDIKKLDVVFLALPHGVSMKFVKKIGLNGPRIIDLSGDFRLKNKNTYEQWYEMNHEFPAALDSAVYGLPELFRKDIADAQLVANPGCYPTSTILALAPALNQDFLDVSSISVDSKSGVTGAGAKPSETTHFPRANEDFRAYKVGKHRHTPEIEEILTENSGKEINVLFTPHLVPLNRGILTTVYAKSKNKINKEELLDAYNSFYETEPFVRVRKNPPNVQSVRGSNYCDVFPVKIDRTNQIVLLSAIDNLVKGAAGQAVQNMNIMLDFNEKQGISHIPLSP